MIGKNASIAAMMIFEVGPKPNQITKIGTNATFGTTWKRDHRRLHGALAATRSGPAPRRPRSRPTSAMTKPTSTSNSGDPDVAPDVRVR